jgi:tetratricopeptide (TPR) repeat protein
VAAGLWLLASGAALAQTGVPDAVRAEIDRGIALFRASNFAAAKAKFTAAIGADPRSADALTWRGIAENQLQQYTEAARDLRAALRLDPSETSAHYNLALSLIRLGQPEDAIGQLVIVTSAHPGVVEPEFNLAILLEGKHSLPEAVDHLQAAFASQPNDPGVAQHLLADLLTLGRADEAKALLQRLPPESSAQIEQQAGAALIEAGRFEAAIVPLEAARARGPETPGLDLLLARAYVGAEECTKAASLLTARAAASADSTGESAYLLGLAYTCTGATSEAKDAFADALRANPSNAAALYHLGLIESTAPAEQPAAIRHLRAAARIEPANAAYAVVLGRVLLAQDQTREAMLLLERIHPRGPEAAERDLLLGISQISLGSTKLAVPTLVRAAAEGSSLPLPQNILGFCYFQQGDYARAAESYAQASDLRPESARFAHDAAVAFERANELDRAMIYAARAVALPEASADDHYLIGKLLARAGRRQDAVNELQRAVALDPGQDAACYLLARTYQQLGDAAQADAWNMRFRELKQRESRDYAERKQAAAGQAAVRTSTLLEGAPVLRSQQDAP